MNFAVLLTGCTFFRSKLFNCFFAVTERPLELRYLLTVEYCYFLLFRNNTLIMVLLYNSTNC